MGLYLCVFDDAADEGVDGVEVGSYDDFGVFRDTVLTRLESGRFASRFPTLMTHSDCDGSWSPDEGRRLEAELRVIAGELAALAPAPLPDGWKRSVARTFGLVPKNLNECFFDVDGEPLVEQLQRLCRISVERGLAIIFQ